MNNNTEKTNKLYYGTLTEKYMGYAPGSKIYFYDLKGCDFALAYESGDENWGYIFSNGEGPMIDIEREITKESTEDVFFTYFELISKKIKIPTSIGLKL